MKFSLELGKLMQNFTCKGKWLGTAKLLIIKIKTTTKMYKKMTLVVKKKSGNFFYKKSYYNDSNRKFRNRFIHI